MYIQTIKFEINHCHNSSDSTSLCYSILSFKQVFETDPSPYPSKYSSTPENQIMSPALTKKRMTSASGNLELKSQHFFFSWKLITLQLITNCLSKP
jgi:hypothetical protein